MKKITYKIILTIALIASHFCWAGTLKFYNHIGKPVDIFVKTKESGIKKVGTMDNGFNYKITGSLTNVYWKSNGTIWDASVERKFNYPSETAHISIRAEPGLYNWQAYEAGGLTKTKLQANKVTDANTLKQLGV